ncbi:MAG: Outer membrane protein assembly factor BamB [Candidatus Argoarchaeum ethanivorans]|uniref:Outer membrane protein assembly factor BamB n=1 Tax=Candidatus Argoarchaeum ethanivorans TaxID=2608793 RepID=A0A811TCY0_9EURY|nr:MAG: Outer membrane protein assembly factor BamB [Candidatus Argoarchaeum ethanivorans]
MRRISLVLLLLLLCMSGITLAAAAQPSAPFIVMGQASYENGIACNNFTLTVTNLNTSKNWDADTCFGYNFYKLVLDGSDIHAGDVLQFNARNTDADTVNISEYQLNDTDRWSLQYNITFISVDVIVLMLDPDGLIHYQPVFMKNESVATVFNATAIACELSNQIFESAGNNVTRVDGIECPVAHLYDEPGGWTNATQDQRLKNGDIIIWSREDEELPELSFVLLPDLSITGEMTIGSDPHAKFMTTVAATIVNRGAPVSDDFDVALVEDGRVIDIRTLPPLDSMEDTTVTFEWAPKDSGDHIIGIRTDPDDLVDERDEHNNEVSRDVVVAETMIIKVPYDYPTVQMAVDNSTEYTVIHIDYGDYESRLTITNRHHLKILGSGEDTRIIVHGGPSSPSKPNLIEIVNSSDIELDGFAVMVDSSYGGSIFPQGWRAINIRESENISLTNLVLTHASWSDCSFLIRIEGSTDCLIADNLISGSRSPADWAVRMATAGILIASDNNTICRNTVSNCQYTVKLQGDNNTVCANNLFFTEAWNSSENAFAIDTGHKNHWNATVPSSYIYNNTTFVNYTGNYWDGWIDEDLDCDGIWDIPYNISDNASDYHPLRKPYAEEYALNVKSISLPDRIYTRQNNTIIAVVNQDSQRITDITVNLTINSEVVESREIKLIRTSQNTIRFNWNPDETGLYNISIGASINDSIVSLDTRRSLFADASELPYNCLDNLTDALRFLRDKQTPGSGSIGGFSTTAWAMLAFSAGWENPDVRTKYGRTPAGYLSSYPSLPYNDFVLATFEDCARTLLAISTLGDADPTNFGNVNYLTMVKSYHDGVQFDDPASVADDALGILALTACGDSSAAERVGKSRGYIISHQNGDGGWSKIIEEPARNVTEGNTTDGNTTDGNATSENATVEIISDLRTTAFIIQALVAAGEPLDSGVIPNASKFLRRNIGYDGNLSNAITTAYAVHAIVAIGENPSKWRNTSINDSATPIDYLMSLQQPDGSFNYTANISFFPRYTTAKVIPALAASPYPPMITDIESYPLPDVTPTGKIDLPETVYVNTSCTVHGTLRCNGGMFNVSLLEDGVSAAVTEVRSIWQDPEILNIPFSIEWAPSKNGFVNITVFVDSDGRVDERYENNNNLTRVVYVNLPDLAIADVVLPDLIYVNVTNLINASVSGITDEHFNVSFVADGMEVDRRRIGGIRGSTNLSYEWRPNRTGNHTISMIADSDSEVREVCEINNTATLVCKVILPDLVPIALTSDVAFIRARNNITVTMNGTAEGFNISLVENGTVVANATNITCYGQTSVNLTYKPTSLGNHTVTAVIDSDGDILETNESNNNLSSIINVTLTDLVPIRILPDIVYLNKMNRITIPVTGTAEEFNASLIAYARDMPGGTITIINETGNATNLTNPVIINATELDTYNNGNLTIWWQPDFPGWYNLTAIVDPDNDVNETNESNNNLTGEAFVANEIQLELVSPRGGEICGGIHPIKWKALHDKNLTIDLFYSSNYGTTWTVIASNLTCDPNLTANLTENLIGGGNTTNTTDASNTTNLTHAVTYNGVYLWDTTNHTDGEYLIRITARWYVLESVYISNTVIVLNGDAASGGIGGNARYFDWDTPDDPHLAWVSEDIFAGGATSIVVADDTVFVYCTGTDGVSSSDYTYMVAMNATNGEMLWATEIAPAEYGSWASPAYHNGSIFIASGMHVYRIDGKTGAILWDYPFSDCCANCNAGPSVSSGRVYVTSFDRSLHPDTSMTCPESKEGNLFCLDVGAGEELWNTSTYLPSLKHLGTPTPKYGRIYYGRGGDLYCMTMDGTVVWNTRLKHDVFSAPVIVDGVVYVSTYEFGQGFGGFNCLDAFNGSILWNYPVQRTDSTPAYFAPRDSDKKYIYVVGGCDGFAESGVYCFNATNGSLIWGSEEVGSWTNSPAVSRDARVFVGVHADNFNYNGLKCLDAYTGDELWSAPYGGSSPYIAYGRVYTIGGNRLYAFGRRELPDLVVTVASASGGAVHATIRNIGTGGTNESFRVVLTRGVTRGGECTVGALDAGESATVTLSGVCGRVMVKADSSGDIPERNEYNNMREVWVPCGGGGSSSTEDNDDDNSGNGDGSTNYGGPGSGGGTGGFVGGGGYWNYYHVGAGADDVETTTTTSTQTMVNETESQGAKHRVKGYQMGAELESGGGGGGYFSYSMILAVLVLLGLLVHGIRKERGRYRRPTK